MLETSSPCQEGGSTERPRRALRVTTDGPWGSQALGSIGRAASMKAPPARKDYRVTTEKDGHSPLSSLSSLLSPAQEKIEVG